MFCTSYTIQSTATYEHVLHVCICCILRVCVVHSISTSTCSTRSNTFPTRVGSGGGRSVQLSLSDCCCHCCCCCTGDDNCDVMSSGDDNALPISSVYVFVVCCWCARSFLIELLSMNMFVCHPDNVAPAFGWDFHDARIY